MSPTAENIPSYALLYVFNIFLDTHQAAVDSGIITTNVRIVDQNGLMDVTLPTRFIAGQFSKKNS